MVPKSGSGKLILYLVTGLVVLSEIVAAAFIVPSKVKEIFALSDQIEETRREAQDLEAEVSVLEGVDQRQIGQELNLALTTLPSEKKVSGLVSSLTSLASSSGTLLLELNLTPGKVSTGSAKGAEGVIQLSPEVVLGSGVSGIPLSIKASGGEEQMSQLMRRLQRISPMVGINSLDYNVLQTGSQANFDLLLYFQPINPTVKREDVVALSSSEQQILSELSQREVIIP